MRRNDFAGILVEHRCRKQEVDPQHGRLIAYPQPPVVSAGPRSTKAQVHLLADTVDAFVVQSLPRQGANKLDATGFVVVSGVRYASSPRLFESQRAEALVKCRGAESDGHAETPFSKMTPQAPLRIDPSSYDKWRRSELGRITDSRERELLLDVMGYFAGCTVLDVGCGAGELAVELSKRRAQVTGIDVSSSMIEAARDRARQHGVDVTFDVATAQSLPFPAAAFDCVVAVTVLCFVEDAASTLREMRRVLRPGGRLVIGELGKWSTWAAARRLRGWLGNPIWRRARFRSAHELRILAERSGFVAELLQGAVYYPPCGLAAQLLGPVDHRIARLTTFGAAFLVLAATKSTDEIGCAEFKL